MLRNRKARVLFVGLKWWGSGPSDFAELSKLYDTSYLHLANLGGPMSRRILGSPIYPAVAGIKANLKTQLSNEYDLTVVINPNRVTPRVLKILSRTSRRLVAWLGDKPVGERALSGSDESKYDCLYLANGDWVADIAGSATKLLPWPHLVPDYFQSPVDRPSYGLSIVGTAYDHRVTYVRRLCRQGLRVEAIGRGWPPDLTARSPMPRLDTIQYLRHSRTVCLNVEHSQMSGALNPWYFDLAASGIPQIRVCNGPGPGMAHDSAAGPITAVQSPLTQDLDPLTIRAAARIAPTLQTHTLANDGVDARISTMLDCPE